MGKYDELVERLKRLKVPVTSFGTTTGWTEHPDAHEAATAITALEAELAAMKARGDALRSALHHGGANYENASAVSVIRTAMEAYAAEKVAEERAAIVAWLGRISQGVKMPSAIAQAIVANQHHGGNDD